MSRDVQIGQFRWLDPAPEMWHLPDPPKGTRLSITTTRLCWIDENGIERCLLPGFPTDGVSFPWVVRAAGLDPWGKSLREAIPHDAGYCLQDYVDFQWLGTKEQVDRRFLVGGLANGNDKAMLYYRAVAAFGGPSWRRENQQMIDGYVLACRQGINDEWIDLVKNGRVRELKAA